MLASNKGAAYRQQAQKRVQKELSELSWQQAAEKIDDEELLALLRQKAALKKQELTDDIFYETYLAPFMNGGIDTTTIPEGSTVKIYLGNTSEDKNPQYDQYSNVSSKNKRTILRLHCTRTIELLSKGEGSFVVTDDSLSNSASPYERNDALRAGVVVKLGRKIADNTTKKEILDPHIRKDVPLYYDDDASDSTITDCGFDVADVSIDGVLARKDIEDRLWALDDKHAI